MEPVIKVEHLTKDYGGGKGIFDVSFAIGKGEVFGFLGPNGAGKTTTIRHLLGFIRPQTGGAWVGGLDSWTQPEEIQRSLGYLPGEIAFPSDMTGTQFIRLMARMRGMADMDRAGELMKRFELDPKGKLRRMSKGMKQKVGIVCAFMHDPGILILDEPTSGLDPLMQNTFVQLVEEEKQRGKTILMSSHMFEEVEKTCDRIGMIRGGKLVATVEADEVRHARQKFFKVEFIGDGECERFAREWPDIAELRSEQNQAVLSVRDDDINRLLSLLTGYRLKFLSEQKRTLEDAFMQYYGEEQGG